MADRRQALAAGAAVAAAAVLPARAAGPAVAIENMRVSPATLQVRPGDRVEWVNRDLVAHTVTARDGSFDSHAIAPGGTWSLVAARTASADYACLYHPAMVARLVVR